MRWHAACKFIVHEYRARHPNIRPTLGWPFNRRRGRQYRQRRRRPIGLCRGLECCRRQAGPSTRGFEAIGRRRIRRNLAARRQQFAARPGAAGGRRSGNLSRQR